LFKKETHKFLGLDPSYTDTGMVIIDQDDNVLIQRAIKTDPAHFSNKFERITHILNEIGLPQITLACIEDYHFGKNAKTSISLIELGFSIRRNFYSNNIPFFTAVPSQIKKLATGSGKSGEKAIILKEVYKKWGFDSNDNNVADAFAMAQMAKYVYNYDKDVKIKMTAKDLEVVKAILKEEKEFYNYVRNH
jgi:crossover junction endodeoxyribonuclease RuvC